MTYAELLQHLHVAGYQRIERDDRLLDVFVTETREKGVELWEASKANETHLLRIRLPYSEKELKLYALATAQLGQLLTHNKTANLADFELIAEGAVAAEKV